MYYLLVTICVMTIMVLTINIGLVAKTKYPLMKVILIMLFAFSMTRYLTLMVYSNTPILARLEQLKHFYFATSLTLPVALASSIWYITPFLRGHVGYWKYLLYGVPWIAFGSYMILLPPVEIVRGMSNGYELQLMGMYPIYLSIAQGSLVFVLIGLCFKGYVKYKNGDMRSQYFLLLLALIMLLIDGINAYLHYQTLLAPFTLSEMLAFVAIGYSFSRDHMKQYKKS